MLSKKQKEEVEFIAQFGDYPSCDLSEDEIDEYIEITVYGKHGGGKNSTNRLFQNKRGLDISVKSWTANMVGSDGFFEPITFAAEFMDEEKFRCPYFIRILNRIIGGLPEPYKEWQKNFLDFRLKEIEDGIYVFPVMDEESMVFFEERKKEIEKFWEDYNRMVFKNEDIGELS